MDKQTLVAIDPEERSMIMGGNTRAQGTFAVLGTKAAGAETGDRDLDDQKSEASDA